MSQTCAARSAVGPSGDQRNGLKRRSLFNVIDLLLIDEQVEKHMFEMRRLIPAGAGLVAYKSLNIIIEGEGIDDGRYQSAPPSMQNIPAPSPSMTVVNEE